MARPPAVGATDAETTRILDGGFWLVLAMAAVCGVLAILTLFRAVGAPASGDASAPTSSPVGSVDPDAYLVEPVRPAPPLALTDQATQPFTLTDLRGSPTFVFFGYTHCPDVCPATIGTIGLAMADIDVRTRAVFVTIDPARDTTEWLTEYVRFLPDGFVGLTGTDAQIADAAVAWGVRYAKVDTGAAEGYAMSHTADVYLVDDAGNLRAKFPFGTTDEAMTATVRAVVAHPLAAASPSPSLATPSPIAPPSATPAVSARGLEVSVLSSSIWSGAAGPVILRLTDGGVRVADTALHPTVRLTTTSGEPVGEPVTAVAVQPPGVAIVSYVATVPIPTPGAWALSVTADTAKGPAAGTVAVWALDPGETPALGGPAPLARTPTLDDVGWRRASGHDRSGTGPAALPTLDHGCPCRPPAVRPRGRLDAVPRVAGMRPGHRHGPVPARPLARCRVHPPRAVPVRRGDRHGGAPWLARRSDAQRGGRRLGDRRRPVG